MSRFGTETDKRSKWSIVQRYALAIATVGLACAISYLLHLMNVRSPYGYIFVFAFGFTLRKAGSGPGIVAGVLGLIGLSTFVHLPGGWFRIGFYNVPFFCLILGTGWSVFRLHVSVEREMKERTDMLTEIKHKYRTLLEAVPLGIALLEEGRKVLQCNSAYEKMLGYGPGEILGKPAPLPDSECHRWGEMEQELKKGKQLIGLEASRVRKDGSIFPASISLTPLFGEKYGLDTGLAVGLIIDETERYERDKAERERLLNQTKALEDQLSLRVISLEEQNDSLKRIRPGVGFRRIIGSSPAIEFTLDQIGMVAPTDSTVLITGETGTGKELVARAIHLASLRANKPLRPFNSATLSPELAMSELFGHEKGSFTGADVRHIGQIELASEGTIFLDEVADMPREAQAMLLRFLQDREFFRLGGTKPIKSDVRVLAATNRELQVAVERGAFRSDLFFRLKDFPIHVPPLRERQEDIDPLVWHFVRLYGKRLGKNIRRIEQRSMDRLHAYPWPGNVRELENVIRTAIIQATGDVLAITESQLPRRIEALPHAQLPFLDMPLDEGVEEYEIARIKDALAKCGGVVEGPDGAAQLLKKRPGSLRYKIRALGIDANWYRGGHGGEK
jgi:PAS domain S-box-containing protein